MTNRTVPTRLLLTLAGAVLALGAPVAAQISAYHGVTASTHQTNFSNLAGSGYRMRSLSVHGTASSPRYTAVWERTSGPGFVAFHDRTPSQVSTFISNWSANGYRMHLFTSVGSGSNIIQAGVMVHDNVDARLTRGLSENGLNNRMSWARDNGFIPKSISVYGTASAPRFAVLLVPNPDKIAWNYAVDTQAEFLDRFNVFTDLKVRPTFVDHNGQGVYASIWRDNRVTDGYYVRVGMSGSGYQSWYRPVPGAPATTH